MGIDVKAIVCPQCGSTDVKIEGENSAICNSCNCKLSVQQTGRQIIYNIYNFANTQNDEDECKKWQIHVTRSKTEFLRNALISLLDESCPLDIYDSEFSPVHLEQRQVLREIMEVDISYSMSVGHDRTEHYTEYEKVPDGHGGYYTEPRTKTKTVTDWMPYSSTHSARSETIVSNDGKSLDVTRFTKDYGDVGANEIERLGDEIAESIQPNESAHKAAGEIHAQQQFDALKDSIRKMKYRDLTYSKRMTGFANMLYLAPEYSLNIKHKGKAYTRKGFAFGGMRIGGSVIEEGLKELSDTLWAQTEKTDKMSLYSLGLTTILAFFVSSINLITFWLSVLLFIISIGIFIHAVMVASKKKKETRATFRQKKIVDLNKKLLSMNLETYSE